MDALSKLDVTRAQLQEHIESLSPQDRAEMFDLLRLIDKRTYWQFHPIEWIETYLKIPRHTIEWSLNPGYEETGRTFSDGTINPEGWDGTPDPIASMFRALASWENVAMPSATGTGKTFAAACAVLWFSAVFKNSKVIFTAPKKDLVERNLWGEITALYETARENGAFADISSSVEPQKTHLQIRMDPDGKFRESWIAFGVVAAVGAEEEAAARMQGYHAEHMLIVLDEAVGLPGAILAAAQNTCTAPHNLRLALGNPNSSTDQLAEFAKGRNVRLIRLSGYDHPNVVGNSPDSDLRFHHQVIPGAVSWGSILDRRQQYGPEPEAYDAHPLYQSRVRGMFPTGSVHSLFTPAAIRVVSGHHALPRVPLTPPAGQKSLPPSLLAPYALPVDEATVAPPTAVVVEHVADPNSGERLEGQTRIYFPPENTHRGRYILSGDVAGDVLEGDWHAAVVYDRVMKRVAAVVRMRGHRAYYARELVRLARVYSAYDWRSERHEHTLLVWERNAGGALHLVEEFAEYENLYRPRPVDKPKRGKQRNQYGFHTNGSSRDAVVEELEDWGLDLRVFPQRVPDPDLLQEMTTFEWNDRKHRYEHRVGQHDDLVMALGIALVVDKEVEPPVEIPADPGRSLLDYKRTLERMKREQRREERKTYGGVFSTSTMDGAFDRATRRSRRHAGRRKGYWN